MSEMEGADGIERVCALHNASRFVWGVEMKTVFIPNFPNSLQWSQPACRKKQIIDMAINTMTKSAIG